LQLVKNCRRGTCHRLELDTLLLRAEKQDAVVKKIFDLIAVKDPKFSNPVGKMTGMFLFLQSYAPKMFEGSILKSVSKAA